MTREAGTTRNWAAFLLAEAAKRCCRLGRLDQADRLLRQALDYGAEGVSGGNVHLAVIELAALVGRWEDAEHHLAETRRLLSRAAGSMWVSPLYGCVALLAELADRRACRWHRHGTRDRTRDRAVCDSE